MTPEWERAVRGGDVAALESQLAAGAEIDARDRYGQTGLMIAAIQGEATTTAWLAQHGADLDHVAKFGLSALMLTVINGHREVVGVLVAAGTDQTLRGSGAPGYAGKNAEDLATDRGDDAMVRILCWSEND